MLINLTLGSDLATLHLSDTYVVLTAATKGLLFIVFSVFAGSLLAAIFNKFKNKLYNKILIFSAFLLFSAGIYIFSVIFSP